MPQFIYSAKTQDARKIRDIEEANTRQELIGKLRARGLFIISIKEVKEKKGAGGGAGFLRRRRGKRNSLKLYDLTFFARNLATTLSSGVTLLRSLEILSFQTESAKLEKILRECAKRIKEGLSLGEAIGKYPKVFSSLWRGIVEVGEASGNLPFVLEKLADYLEMRIEFERKIKSAMIYPSLLMIVAVVVVFVFFRVILPKFIELFDNFGVDLPLATQIVFGIGKFVNTYFFLLLAGFIAAVAGLVYFMRSQETRPLWDKIRLKIPLLGPFHFYACLERLTSTVYILLDSGLPLVYTLEVAAHGIGNIRLEKSILHVKEKVREGSSLSDEFRNLNIFPLLISEMAKIGEETGTMPQVFEKISIHYRKELTTRVERLIAAFEPIMIMVMGLLIGGLVVSLFLPMFRISQLGGGGM
ncbi:MAG: hypothetical protein GF333_06245 [Candidatus Omnitrophica bacterium]|nr:hypothetical protein [Candidatus Omnitrophota bacterium]